MTFKEWVYIPQIDYFTYGTYGSVEIMPPGKLWFLVKNGVSLLIHRHPPGVSSTYSSRDFQVMRDLYNTTGKLVLHAIVCDWDVTYWSYKEEVLHVLNRVILPTEVGTHLGFNYRNDLPYLNTIKGVDPIVELKVTIKVKEIIRKLRRLDYYGVKE